MGKKTGKESYARDFYKQYEEGSKKSAQEIIPIVLDIVQPKTVVDVGCGIGTWLSVFREMGIEDVRGVDGDWVDKSMLLIPEDRFISADLREPLQLGRQFDLVMSLEVAEHLPTEYSGTFVDSLTGLGPVVLFSSAIPFQGGTHHINEQWPEHWVKLFKERGYEPIDTIRRRVWQNENVDMWYAQNVLLFVKQDHLEADPKLKRELEKTDTSQLSIVHPKIYLKSIDPAKMSLRRFLEMIPTVLRNAFRKR